MARIIGLPPLCATKCGKRVSTNRDGYNLKCDECLQKPDTKGRTNKPWNVPPKDDFRRIDRSVPCWCGAEVGQDCIAKTGGRVNGVHKQRKLEANGLWTPGEAGDDNENRTVSLHGR